VSLTFVPDFFTFINRGARAPRPSRESYMVSLEAKPTHANPEARIQPAATRLEVKCADKRYVLVNRNFPVMQVFNWSAQTCGDVLFQIEVGNLLLTREYGGPQGFPRFLQEFQRGERVFTPKDFPGEGNALQSLGINTITVRYAISGHEPVIQLLSAAPARVPTQIVQCIDR
jgi:type VI secretion system protein ImpL